MAFRLKPLDLVLLGGLFLLTGCQDMVDMPRYEPLEASAMYPDQRSARPLVEGAVEWADDPANSLLETGMDENGDPSERFPFRVTLEVLQQGQESYDIFCSPCHGYDGYGQGMIVQRGFSPPPSLHEDRLRDAPGGYIFDVITHGFGQMYAYDYRIPPAERWAIVAYVRALQLSQNAPTSELGPQDMQELEETQP